MRKLLAILIFCCLFFQTAGYHVLYRLRIEEAKREMKKTLLSARKDNLVNFSFSPDELAEVRWEDSQEFFYRGEMYDVLEQKEADGRIIISCISDHNETSLVDAYLNTGKDFPQQSTAAFLKLLTATYLPTSLPVIEKPVQYILEEHSIYQFFLFPWEESILTPPPRIC